MRKRNRKRRDRAMDQLLDCTWDNINRVTIDEKKGGGVDLIVERGEDYIESIAHFDSESECLSFLERWGKLV